MKMFYSLVAILLVVTSLTACGTGGNFYTKDDIMNKTGWTKCSEREFTFGKNIKCDNYWYAGKRNTNYDYLDFYVFDSETDAQKALNYIKEDWFIKIDFEDDDSARGYLAAVCDGSLDTYVHRIGNVIITAEISAYSEWASSPDGPAPQPYVNDDLIDAINNF